MKILVTGGSGFIGTNLIEDLRQTHSILNIDINAPKIRSHDEFWTKMDILHGDALKKIFIEFEPDAVVHLAARTDTDSSELADYVVNTLGSKNVLEAISQESIKPVRLSVITSTQFVNQYSGTPKNDTDYAPHTVYGESKVITETLTREILVDRAWTIIRPTNIWGAWHLRYPYEFWKILGNGMYFHPSGKAVIRSYGYVRNVTWQIKSILEAPTEKVASKVFYVGDRPIDILKWVNGFSLRQRGKPVVVVPRKLIAALAVFGDACKKIGIRFPITSSRFRSMTNSNDAPMNPIFEEFGDPPYSLDAGIEQTVEWLKAEHPHLVRQ